MSNCRCPGIPPGWWLGSTKPVVAPWLARWWRPRSSWTSANPSRGWLIPKSSRRCAGKNCLMKSAPKRFAARLPRPVSKKLTGSISCKPPCWPCAARWRACVSSPTRCWLMATACPTSACRLRRLWVATRWYRRFLRLQYWQRSIVTGGVWSSTNSTRNTALPSTRAMAPRLTWPLCKRTDPAPSTASVLDR